MLAGLVPVEVSMQAVEALIVLGVLLVELRLHVLQLAVFRPHLQGVERPVLF